MGQGVDKSEIEAIRKGLTESGHFTTEKDDPRKSPTYRLYREREALIIYLYAKQQSEDWHAVADAAMDLREIDAKLSVLIED